LLGKSKEHLVSVYGTVIDVTAQLGISPHTGVVIGSVREGLVGQGAIMSSRTSFLGKLIGLYLILISLALAVHKQASIDTMYALVRNAPVLFVAGLMGVIGGLAIVLCHNVWSGGVLPVLVTLTGWSVLIKSALLLFLSPEETYRFFVAGLHYEHFFYQYTAIPFFLGAYLAFSGFAQERNS
jgi:hypothetical protein